MGAGGQTARPYLKGHKMKLKVYLIKAFESLGIGWHTLEDAQAKWLVRNGYAVYKHEEEIQAAVMPPAVENAAMNRKPKPATRKK